jgi:hypothetical protein
MITIGSKRITSLAISLLVAAIVGACASQGPQATPSGTSSASPTAQPSTEPSVQPTIAPSVGPSSSPEPSRFDVPMTIATNHKVTTKVVDWLGLVTAASSGTPGDGASVPNDTVRVANDGPTTLVVTWVGGLCDRANTLVLDDAAGATITVVQEPCPGDAIAFDRIVRLELKTPVDASTIRGVLQTDVDTTTG